MDFRENLENEERVDAAKGVTRLELTLRQDDDSVSDEIDLTALLSNLFKNRKLIYTSILAAIMISLVIFAVRYSMMRNSIGTVSTVVNFNFSGLNRGTDPYGNAFDVAEIKKAEVIAKAIEESGLESKGVTVEDIRRNISISGIIPQDIVDRIIIINQMAEKDPSKLEMLSDINYVSSQYKVDFNIEKKLGLNEKESLQLLKSIIANYREYFIDKYSDKYMLSSAVAELDTTKYDYAEIVMLAEEQLGTIRNYVANKSASSPNFRAKNTGLSFGDILSSIDVVSNVDLNRAQSLIYTFNLSKDPIKLSAIYQNRITDMEKKADQKMGEAANTRQVIEGYEKDTSLMMIGGNGKEPVEMTSGSGVYDSLVKQANDDENEALKLKSESNYYRSLIAKLTGGDTIDAKTKEIYSVEVQEELKNLLERLGEITSITNDTIDSYFETEVYSTAVKIAIEPIYTNNLKDYAKSSVMMVVILSVVAVMLSVIYVLTKDTFKNKHVEVAKGNQG